MASSQAKQQIDAGRHAAGRTIAVLALGVRPQKINHQGVLIRVGLHKAIGVLDLLSEGYADDMTASRRGQWSSLSKDTFELSVGSPLNWVYVLGTCAKLQFPPILEAYLNL